MKYGKAQTGGKKDDDGGTKSITLASSVCGSQAFLGSVEKIHWWALIFPVISLFYLMAAIVEAICHPFQKQNSDRDTHSLAVNHRLYSLGKVTKS